MQFRWHSVGYDPPREEIPSATIPGWEGQKEYFVLQFFQHGEWHDVPVEEKEEPWRT